MDSSFNSERNQLRRTTRGEMLNPEKESTMFCPNCSGSGRYFYPDSGVQGCELCGGAGLIGIEKSRMHEDKGISQPFN
jgi:DnaJ-class molecular chaperone